MTIGERSRWLRKIYGGREPYIFPSYGVRTRRISRRVKHLKGMVECGATAEEFAPVLASAFRRVLALSHHDPELNLQPYLGRKYGTTCSYCHQANCTCQTVRPEPEIPAEPPPITLTWGVRQFQDRLRQMYFGRNSQSGAKQAVLKLAAEISELDDFFHSVVELREIATVEQAREQFAFECCDLLAWILGLANLYEVDLEEELNKRPVDRCHVCNKCPCGCPFYK
ncbi:hypothetical protein HY374_01710 [Candidatus Berkelbacteria bacterium]|nr:hypothetical protein [Candidatus Berkelbacteria bacterium]